MLTHSYAETQTKDRLIWKSGGHAMNIIANNFGVEIQEPMCVLNFGVDEEAGVDALLASMDLTRRGFIVVEPDTNRDWFGELNNRQPGELKQVLGQAGLRRLQDARLLTFFENLP